MPKNEITPAVIAEAFNLYLETGGNLSAVARALDGKISITSLKKIKKESDINWDQEVRAYTTDLAQARAKVLYSNIDTAGLINKLTEKIELLIDNEEEEINIRDLTQAVHAMKGAFEAQNKIKEENERAITWDNLINNKIIEFFMRDRQIRPLLVKKRERLIKYLETEKGKV